MKTQAGPPETSLEPGSVLREAAERAGSEDFGDEAFREPLAVLLRSLDTEARLHASGRAAQRARIVESLVTRARAEQAIARHPEILEQRIEAPVVIVGLARTGTTLLHRLLAASPDFQAARWWEVRHPAPFPGSDWRRDDPRIAAAREEVRLTLETMPVLASVHPWDAEGADEEIMLLEHSFMSWMPESAADVPGYRAWLDRQDLTPAYRLLDRLLRFLAWQKEESGRGGGRWVLKAPFHLAYVETLLRVFPGARILQTHRDPLETIPSTASFYRALWEMNSDAVDPHEVGRQVCDRFCWALGRCMRAREALPEPLFLDVDYREVQADAMAQALRIHGWLGMPLRDEARAAMQAWLADNPRDARPPHRYTLEEFDYDEAALAARFAEYRARHIGTASGRTAPS